MLSGFRCVGLSSVSLASPAGRAPELPEENPPEPSGSTAELAEELRKVSEMAARFDVPLPKAAMPAGETLAERERIIAQLKATGADLSARLREYRENLADSRAIEMRLGLPEAPEPTATAEKTTSKKINVEVPDPKRPFTMLVWRRSDIDAKLRPYVDAVLSGSATAARRYRREALGRHLRLGGRVDALAASLEACRAEAASWPVLRHDFSHTQPDNAKIRRQVKKTRAVADAVVGVRGAVALLCQQPLEEKAVTEALEAAETATANLTAAIRAA
jgi:hypothetical protein